MSGKASERPLLGRWEAALLLLALLLRLGWAFAADTELWRDHIFNDATALSLAEGRGFTASVAPPYDPAVFRTPGYPAFVGAVYALAGHSVRTVFAVQAVLDVLSCLLLWRLVAGRVGRAAARGALLLAATYPFTIYAVGRLSPETLLVLLGLLLVALVDSWPERGGAARVVAAAVVAGALAWVKPVFLPLPFFLLLVERLRRRTWRIPLLRALTVGIGIAILFGPWILRNHRAFGKLVLAGEMGLVVLHGTYDFDEKRDEIVARSFTKHAKKEDRYEATRREFTDSRKLLAKDREHLDAGLERIRSRPLAGFVLDPLRRVPRRWVSSAFLTGPRWIGLGAAAACIGYLLLGAVGVWRLRGRLRDLAAFWLLPALLTASYAAFHAEARYTLPARPSLLLLGGVALAGFAAAISARSGTSGGRTRPRRRR